MLKLNFLPLSFVMMFSTAQASSGLPWHSVVERDTQQMSCSDLKPPTDKEMMAFLESRISDPDDKISQYTLGLNLEDTPEMLRWFWGVHDVGYSIHKNSGEIRLGNTSCRNVVCALEKNYGAGSALRMIYIYAKFGLPTSHLLHSASDEYQNWKVQELDDILVALESLPPTKLPLKDRYILRFKDGRTLSDYKKEPGVYVNANARMDLFDHWAQQSRLSRIRTVIHELGHVVAEKLDASEAWTSLPRTQVSEYAQTNAGEDFAESFTAYRVAPNKLKRASRERYEFLKEKVFAGLEFKTSKECEAPFLALEQETAKVFKVRRNNADWVQKNQSGIREELERIQKVGALQDWAIKYCGRHYLLEAQGGDREKTMECLSAVYRKRAAIVEARDRGLEDLNFESIQRATLKEMSVPRSALLSLREQVRNRVNQELKTFYSQRYLGYYGEIEKAELMIKYPNAEDSEFVQSHHDLIKPLILKAFVQQNEGSFILKIFGPTFTKLLP